MKLCCAVGAFPPTSFCAPLNLLNTPSAKVLLSHTPLQECPPGQALLQPLLYSLRVGTLALLSSIPQPHQAGMPLALVMVPTCPIPVLACLASESTGWQAEMCWHQHDTQKVPSLISCRCFFPAWQGPHPRTFGRFWHSPCQLCSLLFCSFDTTNQQPWRRTSAFLPPCNVRMSLEKHR